MFNQLKSYIKVLIFCFTVLTSSLIHAQSEREIAVMDLTERNGETHQSQLQSVEFLCQVAGIPFVVTDQLESAILRPIIIMTSYLGNNTLSDEEEEILLEYVTKGGIVLCGSVRSNHYTELFGISSYIKSNTNHRINFKTELSHPLWEYLDEPEEKTISLGRLTIEEIFNSYEYKINQQVNALAFYDNGEIAFIENLVGLGKAYSIGLSWKDIIIRSQINRDYEAQRISSNGFEPTQDVWALMIRALYKNTVAYASWKHTSIANSSSTLMITHDIDSKKAISGMPAFAESEKKLGISSTYNLTVRYFADELMSNFYLESAESVAKVLDAGHELGSHSVGHFFDFGDDEIFPIGTTGNTRENYLPYNDGTSTIGGTVFGECETSMNLIHEDFGRKPTCFRTGHLVFNKHLVNVLDSLGYRCNSSFAANTVLTNFPYKNKYNRSFSGKMSNLYEFPVSISDVFQSAPLTESNYLLKAEAWLDVTRKINANGAPTVLLIHPNRDYKLIGQEYYLANIPSTMAVEEMGRFGEYWRDREAFEFQTKLIGEKIYFTLNVAIEDLNENISIFIDNGQAAQEIVVYDQNGKIVEFHHENVGSKDLLIYQYDRLAVYSKELEPTLPVRIYPNPATNHVNLQVSLKHNSDVFIEFFTVEGRRVYRGWQETRTSGDKFISLDIENLGLQRGIYFCRISAESNGETTKRVVIW